MTKTQLIAPIVCALLAPAAAAVQDGDFLQVRASSILLADGSRIEHGIVLVEDGKIRKVGRGVDVNETLPVVELDGVLTAGMIACQTTSGAEDEAFDSTRSVLETASMVHAFDPEHPDFEAALESGVTAVVLTPSRRSLVGGRTAVVKSHGGVVLRRDAHLALSFSKDALAGSPQPHGTVEDFDPFARGYREPTSYSGALRELRERFTEPDGVFASAADGSLPVFIEAWDRNEVARAAAFAGDQGLRGAIRGVLRAGELVEVLQASELGVVLGPFAAGAPAPVVGSAKALTEAGVPIAFAMDAPDNDPAGLRFSAAMAVAAGADEAAIWRALTVDAARIAGVDTRVGRLERGMDADFVVWSGHPLDLSSRVLAVYVGGQLVYEQGA